MSRNANVPPNQRQQAYDAQAPGYAQQMPGAQNIGSPVSNLAYDVISALGSKLEGLEAYNKYSRDGNVQLWQQLAQIDQQAVTMLTQALEQLVQAGELRPTHLRQTSTPPTR